MVSNFLFFRYAITAASRSPQRTSPNHSHFTSKSFLNITPGKLRRVIVQKSLFATILCTKSPNKVSITRVIPESPPTKANESAAPAGLEC